MIYLDNNATTPLDPQVYSAMRPFFEEGFVGNPSSIHSFGQKAKGMFNEATQTIANILGVRPDELIFTSGATEALNFLIHNIPIGKHVITSSLEHSAILEPLKVCGCSVTYLDPPASKGAIAASQIENALQEQSAMIIVSAVNNETGVKTDLESIAQLAQNRNVPLVVDGVALLGKESFHIPAGVSAICFSGHKIHAPLGIGLIVVRKQFRTHPFIYGGPQQRGMRGGTENLPGIIGFRKALELFDENAQGWVQHMTALRERFEQGLLRQLPDCVIHCKNELRICNTSNIAFPDVDGETLLIHLDLAGLGASHGAACMIGGFEPSRVLLNMGLPLSLVRSSLRFSFSRMNTFEEVDRSIDIITQAVNQLRTFKTLMF